MYSFNSRVRYSQVNKDGRLKLVSLLDYFQDCSTFHSEDAGMGTEYLAGQGLAWVLNFWQIDVMRQQDRRCQYALDTSEAAVHAAGKADGRNAAGLQHFFKASNGISVTENSGRRRGRETG